ncbi:MAG: hypothetical protein CME64_14180 [Halobacteriovoraceae bacterium]|nr:hypothetical protein [Halobacteriovoraceae bacterium]|tara:strand:+ start:40771 stop:41535 length:765 start_codon:yes stop_codon:yes gene_type:complete
MKQFTKKETGLVGAEPNQHAESDFEKAFEIKIVKDQNSLNQIFKIRHKVYCEELGYEPIVSSQMESDEYDENSIHFAVIHKRTGVFAGTVRLVFSSDEKQMPLEAFFNESFENVHSLETKRGEKQSTCEVSRLAVLDTFRKRLGEACDKDGPFSEMELKCFPMISTALFYACLCYCDQFNVTAYSMMEKRLARALKIAGVDNYQVGDFHNYHGQRAPFKFNNKINIERFRPNQLMLLNYVFRCIIEGNEISMTA